MSPPRAITRLERSSLSSRAADEIKRSIVTGLYPPGARLPSEKVLAEQLGVTRLTLREALSTLSAEGFTETRHGSGTRVRDFAAEETFQVLAQTLRAGRRLRYSEAVSLMQFRSFVMSAFADTITEGATDEQIAELRSILDAADAASADPVELAELDYRFNETLARATGNFFLTLLMRSVREVHVRLGAAVYRGAEPRAILETQRALVAAIAKRRAARVRKVLRTYLEGAGEVIARTDPRGFADEARPTNA